MMSFGPGITVAVHCPPAAGMFAPFTVTRVTPTLSPATTESTFGPDEFVSVPPLHPRLTPSTETRTIVGLVRSAKGGFSRRIPNASQLKKNVPAWPRQTLRLYSE